MCVLLPHNLIRTNIIFFVPSTDCPPWPCPPRQLLDVFCGFPNLQCHLCHLQQPHQSLLGDGEAALRSHILPHLPPYTSRGSSTKVWTLEQCPRKLTVSPKSPWPKGISYISHCCEMTCEKINLRKEGLVLAHGLKVKSVMIRKQRDVNEGAQLTSLSLHNPGPQPTFKLTLPSSAKAS